MLGLMTPIANRHLIKNKYFVEFCDAVHVYLLLTQYSGINKH